MFSIQPASWLAVLFNLVEFQQTRPAKASVLLWLLSFLRCAPPTQLCRTLFSSSERLDAEYTTLRLRLRLLPNWHSNPQPTVSSASATLLPYSAWTLLYRKEPFLGNLKKNLDSRAQLRHQVLDAVSRGSGQTSQFYQKKKNITKTHTNSPSVMLLSSSLTVTDWQLAS